MGKIKNAKAKKIVFSSIAAIAMAASSLQANPAPGGVSNGLKMWIRADKGLDCYTEGCKPNSWVDQVSGTSFAKDPDPNNGDTVHYELKANNFNPAVNFGGQTYYVGNFDPIDASATSFTLFTVGKRNDTSGDIWQCFFNASADASWLGGGFGLCTSNSGNTDMGFWVTDYSSHFVYSDQPNNAATPTIFSGIYNGSQMIYYTNHYQRAAVAYSGAVGQKVHQTYLGSGSETYQKFCVCDIITNIFQSSTPSSNLETNI